MQLAGMLNDLFRNDPPRCMMAQTMRASLLATATVTTRDGLRANSAFNLCWAIPTPFEKGANSG